MEQELEDRKTEFVVFCIENTAERLKCSGNDVITALDKTHGVEDFLYPSYEALHTQGKDYIVDEVIDYLKAHNPSFITSK
jgi:hypothetical protein